MSELWDDVAEWVDVVDSHRNAELEAEMAYSGLSALDIEENE